MNTQFCSACECLDPAEQEGCGSPQWQGDNYCDDGKKNHFVIFHNKAIFLYIIDNNNAACNWDGGDCCGNNVNTQFCTACECLDPAEQGGCESPQWEGDGYCDDGNNNAGCSFDGGDCCGYNINTQFCNECQCVDPSVQGSCGSPQWQGDNYCDDGNYSYLYNY